MKMSSCNHLDQVARLEPPKLSQSVHREECTRCFDNQDNPLGVDVCLTCFNGGCLDDTRHHACTHVLQTGHSFTLNVKRKLKPSSQRTEDEEPPAKMTKIAIVEDREEDKYEHITVLKCWKCQPQNGVEIPDAITNLKIKSLLDGVMGSMSSARQSEVKAWEEEIFPCEHALTLHQIATGRISASGLAHCTKCDLKENLWLCLTCGSLGCGRQHFGGQGLSGNGHALDHFKESGHGISVKLGTITPEGNADIYCYICDDSKLDPELASHLLTFGINVQTQTKTQKSMTELSIEHNLKYDFSLTTEDGKALEPVFGPGLTGLANLGNSCYMASVLQMIFSLPAFSQRYLSASAHADICPEALPADCIECQMYKIADGLLSGRYSTPATIIRSPSSLQNPLAHESPTPVFQDGIKPTGFKALIGKGHEEFSTMKQQDSEEFLVHLITVLRRFAHKIGREGQEPTEVFAFGMEQRLQCSDCKRVRYRVDKMDVVSVAVPAKEKGKDGDGKVIWEEVQLKSCLDLLSAPEALEYACPACAKNVLATKVSKFSSVPEVLVVHAKKFHLVNWVPAKLDIPLLLPPSDELQLDEYLGGGLQSGEVELPEDVAAAPDLPQFNEAAMIQLEGMGFPTIRCQRALLATGNSDAESAMEWLFAHMEDPDIDSPIQAAAKGASGPEPSAEQVGMLGDMGFSDAQARKALRETGGNAERAVEWLFNHPDDDGEERVSPGSSSSVPQSGAGGTKDLPAKYRLKAFISHKGPSVQSGHYVAHIRVGDRWVLFNDEKVVRADGESVRQLKKLAYLHVFERVRVN